MVSMYLFLFFYKFTKIKTNSFECPKSIRNYEKNNAWNIRRLVDESFVPSTPAYYTAPIELKIKIESWFCQKIIKAFN